MKLSDTQKNSLIRLLKDNVGTGLFGYEFAGEHFDDPDTAGAALAALTAYYDSNADAKVIVDMIMKALPEAMDHTGSLGNANADAMVIAGLAAAGYNPEKLKNRRRRNDC